MPDKRTPSKLWELSKEAQRNSHRWFGEAGVADDLTHHILSLCGATGDLANIIKLIDRKAIAPGDAHAKYELYMKLSSVFTYILNIAAILEIDLEGAYKQECIENERRFSRQKEKAAEQPKQRGWVQLND